MVMLIKKCRVSGFIIGLMFLLVSCKGNTVDLEIELSQPTDSSGELISKSGELYIYKGKKSYLIMKVGTTDLLGRIVRDENKKDEVFFINGGEKDNLLFVKSIFVNNELKTQISILGANANELVTKIYDGGFTKTSISLTFDRKLFSIHVNGKIHIIQLTDLKELNSFEVNTESSVYSSVSNQSIAYYVNESLFYKKDFYGESIKLDSCSLASNIDQLNIIKNDKLILTNSTHVCVISDGKAVKLKNNSHSKFLDQLTYKDFLFVISMDLVSIYDLKKNELVKDINIYDYFSENYYVDEYLKPSLYGFVRWDEQNKKFIVNGSPTIQQVFEFNIIEK